MCTLFSIGMYVHFVPSTAGHPLWMSPMYAKTGTPVRFATGITPELVVGVQARLTMSRGAQSLAGPLHGAPIGLKWVRQSILRDDALVLLLSAWRTGQDDVILIDEAVVGKDGMLESYRVSVAGRPVQTVVYQYGG